MKKRGGEKNTKGFVQLPMWDPIDDKFQDGTQVSKTADTDGIPSATYHEVDMTMEMFLYPPLTAVIQSIMVEIAEEREAGRVRPFVELSLPKLIENEKHRRRGMGEMLGTIQPRKTFKPPLDTPAQRWERQQEEIRTLRKQNDRAIMRILEG
jgi:hypothetical protein